LSPSIKLVPEVAATTVRFAALEHPNAHIDDASELGATDLHGRRS